MITVSPALRTLAGRYAPGQRLIGVGRVFFRPAGVYAARRKRVARARVRSFSVRLLVRSTSDSASASISARTRCARLMLAPFVARMSATSRSRKTICRSISTTVTFVQRSACDGRRPRRLAGVAPSAGASVSDSLPAGITAAVFCSSDILFLPVGGVTQRLDGHLLEVGFGRPFGLVLCGHATTVANGAPYGSPLYATGLCREAPENT